MRKVLITMMMLLALATSMDVAAQKHRHTPQQELTDSTSKDAIEAFSDTTSAATPAQSNGDEWNDDEDFDIGFGQMISTMHSKDIAGMLFVLGVLLIIFVLAPVLIIVALFYFINKNRKDKMRLAQMAMQQGQPIPDQLLNDKYNTIDDDYQKGLRQCFVGIGLMIFLGYAAGEVGFGVGALVFFIGLGKIVASKMAKKNNPNNEL